MNYFTLIEDIKRTSLQFAEEFYEGDVYEFLNSGNHKYPSIILTTQNVSTTDNINSISGTLFCVDRLTDDSSNRLEIQSNAFNKLQRIISALEENTINLQSNTYTPFTEKFADLCGGMFVEFSLQYVGESLCDDLEIKEIELTQNGIYDVIGYDRAIVNVRPVVNLEDITITDNGEYTPSEGFDGFGKVNVDLRGIVKPFNFVKAFYPNNYYNNTFSPIKTANVSKEIGLNLFDLSLVGDYTDAFAGLLEYPTRDFTTLGDIKEMYFDLTGLNAKPTDITRMLQGVNLPFIDVTNAKRSIYIDLSDWDTTNLKTVTNAFTRININNSCYVYIDIKGWKAGSLNATNMFSSYANFNSLVGRTSLEDVVKDDIKILEGLKISISINQSPQYDNLNRASLRALINGLAEVETTQTLTLGAALKAKLTEEDIAIAANKGWSIA